MAESGRNKAGLEGLRLDPEQRRPARRSSKSVGIIIGAVILLAGLAWFWSARSGGGEGAAQTTSEIAPARPAQDVEPSRGARIAAGGYVEARRSSELAPGRDGVVASIHVSLGQAVAASEVLVELEGAAERAEVAMAEAERTVAQARLSTVSRGSRVEEIEAAGAETSASEAALAELRQNRERLESLLPSGATTVAEVDRTRHREAAAEARLRSSEAREALLRRGSRRSDIRGAVAEVDRAEAALDRARARLELTLIRAPFDGTVVRLDVRPGEAIGPSERSSGLVVADMSELWVRVDVPEARIRGVSLGSPARITIDALGGETLEGQVVEIAPLADRQSNTIEVAIRLTAPPSGIRPNMSARVEIDLAHQESTP